MMLLCAIVNMIPFMQFNSQFLTCDSIVMTKNLAQKSMLGKIIINTTFSQSNFLTTDKLNL